MQWHSSSRNSGILAVAMTSSVTVNICSSFGIVDVLGPVLVLQEGSSIED